MPPKRERKRSADQAGANYNDAAKAGLVPFRHPRSVTDDCIALPATAGTGQYVGLRSGMRCPRLRTRIRELEHFHLRGVHQLFDLPDK